MESKSRDAFERWSEINYNNGSPPRFGWECWRDGDGYLIDDDESELDGMWNAWQASRSALVVELPPVSDVESDDTDVGYNICHRSVQGKLTNQGLAFHVQGSDRWITVKGEGDGH